MATIKEDIKENFRIAIEDKTGIVGQVLKDRREARKQEKQVTAQLSKIGVKTARLKNDNRVYKKIEVSTTQISENFQLINKWAGAQVTTQAETVLSMDEAKQTQQQAHVEQLAKVSLPDTKEYEDIFGSILDLFDKFGKKIKLRFPKGLKRTPRIPRPRGRAGRAGRSILEITKKIVKSPIAKVGAVAAVGIAAATYSKGLNTNEEEELEKTRSLPPAITKVNVHEGQGGTQPTYENYGNEGRRTQQVQAPTVAQQVQAPGELGRGTIAQAVAAVAAPLPPAPPPLPPSTPVAAPQPAGPGTQNVMGAFSQVKRDTPTSTGPEPRPQPTAIPLAASTIKEAPTPSSAPPLSSVVNLATNVTIDGINPELAKRAAIMAAAFKKETGKSILVTSGIRTNEQQKVLYDANEAAGGKAKTTVTVAKPMPPLGTGAGSPHLKERGGRALDINSKGPGGINILAGPREKPTGWLEKFGLARPVDKENWHIQLAGTPPAGDNGLVPGKDGKPTDPDSGNSVPVPVDPNTGEKLLDSSKTVDQLKKEQSQLGTDTIVVTKTTNVIVPNKKKKPQGQTTAALS